MTTTTTSRRSLRRVLAGTTAAGVAAAGLALMPSAPAQAAEGDLALNWEISERFDAHLNTHVLGDGATESEDGVVTFPAGEGSYNPVTGETEVAYQGSIEGSFAAPGFGTLYRVTLEDPSVTVDGEGNGQISALVSAWNAAFGGPEASTDPARVVVTTFDAAAEDWTSAEGVASLTATPHWDGVLPEGEESAALGIPAGQPIEGRSFAPSFLGQLTSGVRAHFYASGASSDATKAPAEFTLTADEVAPLTPAVEITSSEIVDRSAVIGVSGTGFTAVTNPGDAGVYVGLAPSGGLPDVSSQDGMDAFAAADWVMPARIVDNAFTSTLTAASETLDPSLDYSVYTWQAHAHSNTSQDTETPVEIDFDTLTAPVESSSKLAVKAPTTKRVGKATVKVTGEEAQPTGQVKFTYKAKGAKAKTWTKKLNGAGKASVKLPRSKKGKATVKVAYLGDDSYTRSTATKKVTVKAPKATKKNKKRKK